jgi:hypothetical protein
MPDATGRRHAPERDRGLANRAHSDSPVAQNLSVSGSHEAKFGVGLNWEIKRIGRPVWSRPLDPGIG